MQVYTTKYHKEVPSLGLMVASITWIKAMKTIFLPDLWELNKFMIFASKWLVYPKPAKSILFLNEFLIIYKFIKPVQINIAKMLPILKWYVNLHIFCIAIIKIIKDKLWSLFLSYIFNAPESSIQNILLTTIFDFF